MPDWSMESWETGKRMTLLEAFGIDKIKFHYPELKARLPSASAKSQHPIRVQSSTPQGSPGSKNPTVPKKGPYQQYARKLLRDYGWHGQWSSYNSLEMREDGYQPNQFNTQGSGAYGIAQALGHGNGSATQGTQANEYGGYGLTDKQARAANSGDGYWQLVWMMNYIKEVYGSPDAAWQHEQQFGWY